MIVSVIVASHGRPLRLRWLLNALEAQTFDEPWELIVAHTYDPATAARVLTEHPLHEQGRLRQIAVAPADGSPSYQRNLGWRAAAGSLIAFTDDDCRPEPAWLARLVAAARADPGVIVQGTTRPDPCERAILAAPHVRTMFITPVNAYRQTCNILYPRSVLDELGGFDERAITGEDVGLSLRAQRNGTVIVAEPDAVVFHAVESHTLPGIVRQNLKWRHLAYLIARHPEFREEMPARIFWDRDHLRTAGLIVGLVAAPRRRAALVAGLPYVRHALGRRGPGRRARAVAAAELPGQAVRQIAEVVVMAYGGLREKTVVL